MVKFSLLDAQKASKGRLLFTVKNSDDNTYSYDNIINSTFITGVSIDSRKVNPGDLYVSIKGEKVDGHNFVLDALSNGASCLLIKKEMEETTLKKLSGTNAILLIVEDTVIALGDIAKWYKSSFDLKTIGVTGSSGKTTTKDMIAAVMKEGFSTHKNDGNFNNEIGLPLTVFGLEKNHEIAVLEMGMSEFGEIDRLSEIGVPDIAVITNIGTAHMEFLGTRENIMKAKLEIFEHMNSGSIGIINGDDEYLTNIKKPNYKNSKIFTYGFSEGNDFVCSEVKPLANGGNRFMIKRKDVISESTWNLSLNLPGKYNILNATAAAICGIINGLNEEQIQKGLESFKPSKNRMEIFEGINGVKVINDSYNANPESMKAVMDMLGEMGRTDSKDSLGRRIAVIGDMLELGENKQKFHLNVLKYTLENKKADLIITYGNEYKCAYEKLSNEGLLENLSILAFLDKESLLKKLKEIIASDDVILIKGSLGMKMLEVVESLRK